MIMSTTHNTRLFHCAECILPYHGLKSLNGKTFEGMEVIGARNLRQAFEAAV